MQVTAKDYSRFQESYTTILKVRDHEGAACAVCFTLECVYPLGPGCLYLCFLDCVQQTPLAHL